MWSRSFFSAVSFAALQREDSTASMSFQDIIGGADVVLPTREPCPPSPSGRSGESKTDASIGGQGLRARRGLSGVPEEEEEEADTTDDATTTTTTTATTHTPATTPGVNTSRRDAAGTPPHHTERSRTPSVAAASDSIRLQVYIGRLPSMQEYLAKKVGKDSTRNILATPKAGSMQRRARQAYVTEVERILNDASDAEWVPVMELYVHAGGWSVGTNFVLRGRCCLTSERWRHVRVVDARLCVSSACLFLSVFLSGCLSVCLAVWLSGCLWRVCGGRVLRFHNAPSFSTTVRAEDDVHRSTTTESGQARDWDRLAAYFLAMIKLYTEMCLDRNYVCISVVQRMFSRRALFRCLQEERLHPSVRAACCRLLLHAYVDVQPQEEVTVAERPRLWTSLSDEPTLPPQRFRRLLSEKDLLFFTDLRAFLVQYIVECVILCHALCAVRCALYTHTPPFTRAFFILVPHQRMNHFFSLTAGLLVLFVLLALWLCARVCGMFSLFGLRVA